MQIYCALDWSIRFSNVGLDNKSHLMLSHLKGNQNSSHPNPNILPELDLTWCDVTSRQLGYFRLTKIQSILVSSFTHSPMIFKYLILILISLSKLGGGTFQRSFLLYISIQYWNVRPNLIFIFDITQIRPLAVARDKKCPLELIHLLVNATRALILSLTHDTYHFYRASHLRAWTLSIWQ